MPKDKKLIFAIETSCDETSCAVVKNGREVLSNVVATQIEIHRQYGGVVPEVAARKHLESINLVIDEAIAQANVSFEDIDAIAATVKPGLVGCLLVGVNAGKTLGLIHKKPFIEVNHLNAHVCANYIDTELEPPFLSLLISGGHTQIIKVSSYNDLEIIGETMDDSVGEAYDKVARLMGLPYPGGPELDKLAKLGDKNRFKLPKAKTAGKYDFSFSGLKTAMLRLIQELKQNDPNLPVNDLCASFQQTVSATLFEKTLLAAKEHDIKQIALAGGVAANSEIRRKFFELESQDYRILCAKNEILHG
jgi:N6-L-threonylcarbamoyladenine synthase